jgi:DMSO/TMAO reductase YedYZ heme-binding membrane subunit
VATTRSRPRGRELARPNTGGPIAEHKGRIIGVAIGGVVIILAFLSLTGPGQLVARAVQNFLLFYGGVICLMTLCASVGAGLAATDRMFLNPGHRVAMQAVHRAVSFCSLLFLLIHVTTEILAQRVNVIDVFIPFLSPFKTFYIGLGTIAGDIMIMLLVTGLMRAKFLTKGTGVWRWRAIHYFSYVAFIFGIWHGLLGGRAAKPYYSWSYGVCVFMAAGFVAFRILANSLRPKEHLSSAPVSESAASGSAPIRAAAMLAEAGLGTTALAGKKAPAAAALGASSRGAGSTMDALPAAGARGWASEPMPALEASQPEPVYEPGYDGPPRYQGAPGSMPPMRMAPGGMSGAQQRPVAPMASMAPPRSALTAGPMSGPMQAARGPMTGGYEQAMSGPMRQIPPGMGAYRESIDGPVPVVPGVIVGGPSPTSGPMPAVPGGPSGASQRPMTGPMRQAPGPVSGPMGAAPGPMTGGYQRPMRDPMPPASGPMTGGYPAPEPVTGEMMAQSGMGQHGDYGEYADYGDPRQMPQGYPGSGNQYRGDTLR